MIALDEKSSDHNKDEKKGSIVIYAMAQERGSKTVGFEFVSP